MKTTAFCFLVFWLWFFAIDIIPANWLMYALWLVGLIGIASLQEKAYTQWRLDVRLSNLKQIERDQVENYCDKMDTLMAERHKPRRMNPTIDDYI